MKLAVVVPVSTRIKDRLVEVLVLVGQIPCAWLPLITLLVLRSMRSMVVITLAACRWFEAVLVTKFFHYRTGVRLQEMAVLTWSSWSVLALEVLVGLAVWTIIREGAAVLHHIFAASSVVAWHILCVGVILRWDFSFLHKQACVRITDNPLTE